MQHSTRRLWLPAVATAVCLLLVALLWRGAASQADSPATAPAAAQGPRVVLPVAQYDSEGKLLKPAGLPEWTFLGVSLGMGYSAQPFDDDNPGMFQLVLMEPTALSFFEQHGYFADGTLFALYFYGSAHRVSTNRSGFVLGGEMGVQVHVVDKHRFRDGHAFFDLGPYAQAQAAEPLPPGNGCVSCHKTNAAYDGVFAQFYPRLKPRIPQDDLARAMARGTENPPLIESH